MQASIQQLDQMVTQMVGREDVDYTKLGNIVFLIDACICSEAAIAERPLASLEHMKHSLDDLNHQIREVRGYNLIVTKVLWRDVTSHIAHIY